jgi:hypothetical protein
MLPLAPGPVLDDQRLAELFRHLLPEHARQRVDRAAGDERHDHADRLRRIALRRRTAGGKRERGQRDRERNKQPLHGTSSLVARDCVLAE